MTTEAKQIIHDAWLPASLVAIGILGLIVKAAIAVIPLFVGAVADALD